MSSVPRFPIPVTVEATAPRRAQGRAARVERAGVLLRPWLPWIHALMFVSFLALLLGPVALPEDHLASQLGGLGNWLIWGIWFPLVFVSVLFSGRSWCGVLCPMGAASEWVNRVGLKRSVPSWLRWEGTPVVSFVLITILGQTVGVRDYPEALLEVFGGTLVAALAIGFLYGRNKRAWCRHACPIGLLLGVFSRLGIVQFTPKHKKPGGDAYTTKGMCPTMIDIPRKEESRHCIECFRCVHPDRKGGLMVRLRHPGEEIEAIREHHPNATEVAFLFLGTGVSLGGFLWLVLPSYQAWRQAVGEWAIDHGAYWIGQPGPWWLMSVHPAQREVFNWLDFSMIVGYMSGWMLAVAAVLSVTTVLATAAAGRLGASGGFRQRFVELGYQYAPVAMVSLILGLASELFAGLSRLEPGLAAVVKVSLLAGSLLWSLYLGNRILARQGLDGARRWPALVPGAAGTLAVAAAWWPVIFGV